MSLVPVAGFDVTATRSVCPTAASNGTVQAQFELPLVSPRLISKPRFVVLVDDWPAHNASQPDSMAFNEELRRCWSSLSHPRPSTQVGKAIVLKKIAGAQEKNGVLVGECRSSAEAQLELRQAQAQSSQAAALRHPLALLANTIQGAGNWLTWALSSSESLAGLDFEFSQTMGEVRFIARKTRALNQCEAQGAGCSKILVSIGESSHDAKAVQNGITAYLARHFNAKRGDIFLAEASGTFPFVDGKRVSLLPNPERDYGRFCHGVPISSCRFLREPREMERVRKAQLARAILVDEMFEYLMSSISRDKAGAARQSLAKQQKGGILDTDIKMRLVIDNQRFCVPSRKEKLSSYVDPSLAALQELNAAHDAASKPRDDSFFDQFVDTLKKLPLGAYLFSSIGIDHQKRLEERLQGIEALLVYVGLAAQTDET